MRGGVVNKDKVRSFRALTRLLYKLKVIRPWQYRLCKERSLNINPLISANGLFIDKFEK